MSLSNKVKGNGRETLPKGFKLEGLEFIKAKDLVGKEFDPIILKGYFFNKGKFGKGVALVGVVDGKIKGINVPGWYIKTFEELTDDEVAEILDGKQALASVEEFETESGNTSYRINIIDVE